LSLLDQKSEAPPSKVLRYAVSGVALALLLSFAVWYFFLRYLSEQRTIRNFMDLVVAEKFEEAYRAWQPQPSYTYGDFLADWGPDGYYGPVRSYNIFSIRSPGRASGSTVVVELSPDQPFPPQEDAKSARVRVVRLWVEARDLSMGFAP
jgi:hypothetical protein